MQQLAQQGIDTRNSRHCEHVVASLPITNSIKAHQILHELLTGMYDAPPPPAAYLAVLELARQPLIFLQENVGTRYASRPLPADSEESAAFERTVALWRLASDSYARVAQLGGGEEQIRKQLGLVCQRCVHYAGQSIVEHYRARRSLAPRLWIDLHGYYETAEEWGFADEPVAEPIGGTPTTASEAYAAVLLTELANPYSRTPKELSWILRWARKMAAGTVLRQPETGTTSAHGYSVDLMQDRGPRPADQVAMTLSTRLFDTSGLGERVQTLLGRLKDGYTPGSLGLGDDCPKTQAQRLLLHLYRPWCLAAMPRRFERNRASGTLAVAYEIESIYFHLTNAEFVQPSHVRTYSRAEVDEMITFKYQLESDRPVNLAAVQARHPVDAWEIADQSLNGFRVLRLPKGPRIEHGQLMAVKPPNKDQFVLAHVTWLALERDGRLQAGLQLLPSPSRGIKVRGTGGAVSPSDKYSPGFFLPAVPALKEQVSIILPAGWYSPGRVIEILTDRPVLVKLGELLARGANFERSTFTLTS
jgi:hypothetical protein